MYNNPQLEIQYFWPLTEQIELDLDYSGCNTKYTSIGYSNAVLSSAFQGDIHWGNGNNAGQMAMRIPIDMIFLVEKEPNFIRKLIYKLIGLKWEATSANI